MDSPYRTCVLAMSRFPGRRGSGCSSYLCRKPQLGFREGLGQGLGGTGDYA